MKKMRIRYKILKFFLNVMMNIKNVKLQYFNIFFKKNYVGRSTITEINTRSSYISPNYSVKGSIILGT